MYRSTRRLFSDHYGLLLFGVAAFTALQTVLLGSPPSGLPFGGVMAWWTGLCAVSVLNVCFWCGSAAALARRKGVVEPRLFRFQSWQLMLSAVYVLGCAFRSILPRADVQRIGLYDSWLSSVMVGRSVATLAELCFVAQWALLLNWMARDAGSRFGVVVSWLIIPLIAVAEVSSWFAVLTTNYLGNAIEESIWAVTAVLFIVSCLMIWPRCRAGCRPVLAVAVAFGIGYVTFMCLVDVPMYVSRWLEDLAAGREALTLAEGLKDVWSRRHVTFDWEQWRTEIPWMSLYFSVAVWSSIALIHAPWFRARPRPVPATV